MRILLIGSRETGQPLGLTLQKRGYEIDHHFGEEDGFGDVFERLAKVPEVLRKTDAIIIHGDIFPSLQRALKTFRNHFAFKGQILVCRSRESPYTEAELVEWGATGWFIHLSFRHQGAVIARWLSDSEESTSSPPAVHSVPRESSREPEQHSETKQWNTFLESALALQVPNHSSPRAAPEIQGDTMPTDIAIIGSADFGNIANAFDPKRQPQPNPLRATSIIAKHQLGATVKFFRAHPETKVCIIQGRAFDDLKATVQELNSLNQCVIVVHPRNLSSPSEYSMQKVALGAAAIFREGEEGIFTLLMNEAIRLLKRTSAPTAKTPEPIVLPPKARSEPEPAPVEKPVLAAPSRETGTEERIRQYAERMEKAAELVEAIVERTEAAAKRSEEALKRNEEVLRKTETAAAFVFEERRRLEELLKNMAHALNAFLMAGKRDGSEKATEEMRGPSSPPTTHAVTASPSASPLAELLEPNAERASVNGHALLDKANSTLHFDGTHIRVNDQEALFLEYVMEAKGLPIKASAMEGVKYPSNCAYALRLKMDRHFPDRPPYLQSSHSGYCWKE